MDIWLYRAVGKEAYGKLSGDYRKKHDVYDQPDRVRQQFEKYFAKHISIESTDFIDWKKSFAKKGLDYKNYTPFGVDMSKIIFVPKKNLDLAYVEFAWDIYELFLFEENVPVLYTAEIGYQRRGLEPWVHLFAKEELKSGEAYIFTRVKIWKIFELIDPELEQSFASMVVNQFQERETFLHLTW